MSEIRDRTEERIDAVLHALRAAGPRPGMDERILAALRDAEANLPATSLRHGWLRWPAMSCAAGVTVIACVLLWHGQPVRPPARLHVAATEFVKKPEKALAADQPIKPISEASVRPQAPVIPSRQSQRSTAFAIKDRAHVEEAVVTAKEQSFPAPPLPLTEQERLLLRVVHRSDPVQLAQLTPAAREAELQRERDDVSEFFAPPPPLEQPVQ